MTCQTVDFTIRKGDLVPAIVATLYNTIDGVSTVVDLTGATIEFVYKPLLSGSTVTRTAAISGAATLGKVTYVWITADTLVAGDFNAYWRVTFPSTKVGTYPNKAFNLVQILESL